jgi:hypothetical protein
MLNELEAINVLASSRLFSWHERLAKAAVPAIYQTPLAGCAPV